MRRDSLVTKVFMAQKSCVLDYGIGYLPLWIKLF